MRYTVKMDKREEEIRKFEKLQASLANYDLAMSLIKDLNKELSKPKLTLIKGGQYKYKNLKSDSNINTIKKEN